MDAGDVVGPREHEQIAVALEVVRMVREPRAAELVVGELQALNHRAHGAVEDEDAPGEELMEQGCSIGRPCLNPSRRPWRLAAK